MEEMASFEWRDEFDALRRAWDGAGNVPEGAERSRPRDTKGRWRPCDGWDGVGVGAGVGVLLLLLAAAAIAGNARALSVFVEVLME